jgi:hypothetical protein
MPIPLLAFLARSLWLRIAGLMFKAFWWSFVAVLAWFSNHLSPVAPIYLLVAGYAVHTVYRAVWFGGGRR